MFESSSIMVMCDDKQQSIKRLEVDADTQSNICKIFNKAVKEMIDASECIEFDGNYKPERDEVLFISNFQLADEIKDAVRDPMGVSAYKEVSNEYPSIKSILIGYCEKRNDTEKFYVAIQKFRRGQYISTRNINLFWSKDTFRREKNFGISISDIVDCYYSNGELRFKSFFFARQVFDLSIYYRAATSQEVAAFISNEHLSFEDGTSFESIADTSIRRKIAMINDSAILTNYSAKTIRTFARQVGIDINVQNGKIVIPTDRGQIKIILGFLDEEAYKGPFSQNTYLANSKRKIQKK